ncbi:type III pantothenate kinase [Reichenbachiella agarivorans]|uniref:Type III pantothenate kinase n=1 Tax=Reichenbachiella agarivorans TaxID=2979464 RepID=A0ABY6CTT5_9BACT|nr:type III pantothenate kinase [Reichenbachiella agarivorans]UXP33284.1 type III pantothenate kinase [Reichenbachiella agarivorans]
MNLVAIDIGNTRIKIGVFIEDVLSTTLQANTLHEVQTMLNEIRPERVITCSVSTPVSEQRSYLSDYNVLYLTPDTPVPVHNRYESKMTLGLDRLAAVVGAESLGFEQDVLVIDVGTCITYDLLDRQKNYHGGSISPGIELRFKSMNDYTKNLPLITDYQEANLVGKSTREALISGVICGIAAEIQGMIGLFRGSWPDLKVIMCGGGANRFESKLKESIFASPELVLVGLKRILEYNEDKK